MKKEEIQLLKDILYTPDHDLKRRRTELLEELFAYVEELEKQLDVAAPAGFMECTACGKLIRCEEMMMDSNVCDECCWRCEETEDDCECEDGPHHI